MHSASNRKSQKLVNEQEFYSMGSGVFLDKKLPFAAKVPNITAMVDNICAKLDIVSGIIQCNCSFASCFPIV